MQTLYTLKPPYFLLSVKSYITADITGQTGLTPSTQLFFKK